MKKLTNKVINTFEKSEDVLLRLAYKLIQHGVQIESMPDIANYGAQNGYAAITYYTDTCKFYNDNKDEIWEFAIDQSDELGSKNVFEMLSHFGGAKDVGGAIQFENLMTWYIAEEVSRHLSENYKIEQ